MERAKIIVLEVTVHDADSKRVGKGRILISSELNRIGIKKGDIASACIHHAANVAHMALDDLAEKEIEAEIKEGEELQELLKEEQRQ